MPDFRREVPEYVPEYRRIPYSAPAGTYYCEPCDELHYPEDICWYYDGDLDDLIEEEHAIGATYPEWSGVMETYHDFVFFNEKGEVR